MTPLHYAASSGHMAMCRLIIENAHHDLNEDILETLDIAVEVYEELRQLIQEKMDQIVNDWWVQLKISTLVPFPPIYVHCRVELN